MPDTVSSPMLRGALLADAACGGAMALLLIVAAGALAPMLGLPETLLRGAGLLFLPWDALVAFTATRPSMPRMAVIAIIGGNFAYVAGCILALALGWLTPTTLGLVVVVGQALVVFALAEAQLIGFRRSARVVLAAA